MFNLPEDHTSQVLWHRDLGNTCYEFNRVYGPDGRLDRNLSFWLVTPLNPETPVIMYQLSYGEYHAIYGPAACSFDEFSSPSQPPARIHEWLIRKPRWP